MNLSENVIRAHTAGQGAIVLRCVHSPLQRSCVTDVSITIYRSSTQRTAPQGHFLVVPQCSSRRRDGITITATSRNADAVDYERTYNHPALTSPVKWSVPDVNLKKKSLSVCMLSKKAITIMIIPDIDVTGVNLTVFFSVRKL